MCWFGLLTLEDNCSVRKLVLDLDEIYAWDHGSNSNSSQFFYPAYKVLNIVWRVISMRSYLQPSPGSIAALLSLLPQESMFRTRLSNIARLAYTVCWKTFCWAVDTLLNGDIHPNAFIFE